MNKNSRRKKAALHKAVVLHKAVKRGESDVIFQVPVYNYHNYSNDQIRKGEGFRTQTVPVPVLGGDGVVSRNRSRNMQMKVRHNKGTNGCFSNTSHEPIDSNNPVRHLNHAYILKEGGYKQPARFRATT